MKTSIAVTKTNEAIKAVQAVFADKSVSQATTRELLETIQEEIELLLSTLDK